MFMKYIILMDFEIKKYNVVKMLIITNVIFFVPRLIQMLTNIPTGTIVNNYLALNVAHLDLEASFPIFLELLKNGYAAFNYGALWQVVTSFFLHANLLHIFFNMYLLYLFGRDLESIWGSMTFTVFYFTVGILSSIASAFMFMILNIPLRMLGASGAVFGVILAYGTFFSERMIGFFFIPMKVKWAVLIMISLELVLQLSAGGSSGIAHFAHLFGALFAFLFILIFFKKNAVHEMFFKKYYIER